MSMFNHVITLAPKVARDKFGKYSVGTGVKYDAKVRYKTTKVMNANAELVIASGFVIIKSPILVNTGDVLTLPDGRTPLIIAVEQGIEVNPLAHTKVYFV